MENHAKKTFAGLVIVPIVLLAAVYLFLGFYYRNTYAAGTWINGSYVTGLSVEEANGVLCSASEPEGILVTGNDGSQEMIAYRNINYSLDYRETLTKLQKEQKKLLWGYYLLYPEHDTILPEIQYDSDFAVEEIHKLGCYKDSKRSTNPQVKISKGKDGYQLIDETVGAVDPEKLVNTILEAVDQGKSEIDLRNTDCYKEYFLSDQMAATKELFQKVDAVQSTEIIYSMEGKTLALSKGEIADWIAVDEHGDFVLDELGDITISANQVDAFTMKLAETFDSIGKDREWSSTSGRTVSVNNATFGFKVDTEAEKEQLIVSVCNGIHQEREPFSRTINVDIGTGEIGDTYIEVDMSAQMLYYYVDGVLSVKTPVVTGNTSRGRGTPEKVCYVYMKQKNRTLKGANYAAFVNYWMPVLGNIGLHDAGWRDEFGGDIYETNGSHGCINLPKEAAAKIYDQVEIGTPVVMYY